MPVSTRRTLELPIDVHIDEPDKGNSTVDYPSDDFESGSEALSHDQSAPDSPASNQLKSPASPPSHQSTRTHDDSDPDETPVLSKAASPGDATHVPRSASPATATEQVNASNGAVSPPDGGDSNSDTATDKYNCNDSVEADAMNGIWPKIDAQLAALPGSDGDTGGHTALQDTEHTEHPAERKSAHLAGIKEGRKSALADIAAARARQLEDLAATVEHGANYYGRVYTADYAHSADNVTGDGRVWQDSEENARQNAHLFAALGIDPFRRADRTGAIRPQDHQVLDTVLELLLEHSRGAGGSGGGTSDSMNARNQGGRGHDGRSVHFSRDQCVDQDLELTSRLGLPPPVFAPAEPSYRRRAADRAKIHRGSRRIMRERESSDSSALRLNGGLDAASLSHTQYMAQLRGARAGITAPSSQPIRNTQEGRYPTSGYPADGEEDLPRGWDTAFEEQYRELARALPQVCGLVWTGFECR